MSYIEVNEAIHDIFKVVTVPFNEKSANSLHKAITDDWNLDSNIKVSLEESKDSTIKQPFIEEFSETEVVVLDSDFTSTKKINNFQNKVRELLKFFIIFNY